MDEQAKQPLSQSTQNLKTILMDVAICFLSALLVSGSLYFFSNYNRFAPGGVTGFASIIGSTIAGAVDGDVTTYMSILMFSFNLPIFVLVAIFCLDSLSRHSGCAICGFGGLLCCLGSSLSGFHRNLGGPMCLDWRMGRFSDCDQIVPLSFGDDPCGRILAGMMFAPDSNSCLFWGG